MDAKGKLFEIADCQQGYFTSRQAERCGFHRSHFQRYLNSKEWIKELRGIYRLAFYPVTERPELVKWSLWSQNRNGEPQGVWSHDTALDIYDLCDVMPAKMHMTVPKHFRRTAPIPSILRLHYEDLKSHEFRKQQGYCLTTPQKTLCDIALNGKLSEDLITQAIREALRRGLVLEEELRQKEELRRFL